MKNRGMQSSPVNVLTLAIGVYSLEHRKCKSCHHEWDGNEQRCDWCGDQSTVIGNYNPFPRGLRNFVNKLKKDLRNDPRNENAK